MKLTRYTDYGLRVLIYLAATHRRVTVSDIARAYDISQNHLVKVVHDLAGRGYIKSFKGRNGGIELARPANEINIGKVVRVMESDLLPIDCAGCAILGACNLPGPLVKAMAAFLAVLDGYSLADVAGDGTYLGRLLGLDQE